MSVVGTTYLLKGRKVVVLAATPGNAHSPRNVLIEFEDGSRTVRPMRGLRVYRDVLFDSGSQAHPDDGPVSRRRRIPLIDFGATSRP